MRKLCLFLLLGVVTDANANGRFPQTMSVTFRPGSDQEIFVGSTFGLLLSPDDGATWRWICEDAIGYSGAFDPVYLATSSGVLLATTVDGLSASHDGGCSWSFVPDLAGHWVADVTLAEDGKVWAVTSSSGLSNGVFVSDDEGSTFLSGLESSQAWWKSIRVAPSDPGRIYVSGYELDDGSGDPAPLLYRSDDGGETWTQLAFAFDGESQLRIVAVAPTDADLVFARVDAGATDTVLRSEDGAVSWTPVLTVEGNVTGFVVRDDGSTVIAGSMYDGVRISVDGGETYRDAETSPRMVCLDERDDEELFACGANWDPDYFSLARSQDGDEWEAIFRFNTLDGPLECPAGTAQKDICEAIWPTIAEQFGIGQADAGVPVDASTVDDPAEPAPSCGCGIWIGLAALWMTPSRRRRSR